MARHSEALFSFEYPGDWEMRTMSGVARSPAFQAATIVLVREPRYPGDTEQMHAQRQLFEMRGMTDFGLHESSSVKLGGLPAARIRYSYPSKEGRLEQSQTCAVDPLDPTQMVTILTTARVVDLAAVKPVFDAALASVRFDLPAPTPREAGLGEMPVVPIPGVPVPRR